MEQSILLTDVTQYDGEDEMTEPGYYWWLPLCSRDEPDKPENWSIVSWHPRNPERQKSGIFVGPLTPPTGDL